MKYDDRLSYIDCTRKYVSSINKQLKLRNSARLEKNLRCKIDRIAFNDLSDLLLSMQYNVKYVCSGGMVVNREPLRH